MTYLDRKFLDRLLSEQLERLEEHCKAAASSQAEKTLLEVIRYIEKDRPGGVGVEAVLNILLESDRTLDGSEASEATEGN